MAALSDQSMIAKSVPDGWLTKIRARNTYNILQEGMLVANSPSQGVSLVYSEPYLKSLGGLAMAQVFAEVQEAVSRLGGQFSDY